MRLVFYQDNRKNCCVAMPTEPFFEEVLLKNNEQFGLLFCIYILYDLGKPKSDACLWLNKKPSQNETAYFA